MHTIQSDWAVLIHEVDISNLSKCVLPENPHAKASIVIY